LPVNWRNFLPGVQHQFILRASPLLSQPSDQVKLSRRDAAVPQTILARADEVIE
jgi:hypothetical protein